MIERYSLPQMETVWAQQNKFQKWLDVEVAVAEGLAEYGYIPRDAPAKIKAGAKFTVDRILEIEETTQHDVMAFVKAVTENLGDEGKYVHYGITSYDVVDTALSLLMRESADIIIADLERLAETVKTRAKEHKYTLMIGRTHGIHAEPITFGFKLAGWYAQIRRDIERMNIARKAVSV
ncbi:MAG: lyase family protein, partial [Armatimonadota bacterium]